MESNVRNGLQRHSIITSTQKSLLDETPKQDEARKKSRPVNKQSLYLHQIANVYERSTYIRRLGLSIEMPIPVATARGMTQLARLRGTGSGHRGVGCRRAGVDLTSYAADDGLNKTLRSVALDVVTMAVRCSGIGETRIMSLYAGR